MLINIFQKLFLKYIFRYRDILACTKKFVFDSDLYFIVYGIEHVLVNIKRYRPSTGGGWVV